MSFVIKTNIGVVRSENQDKAAVFCSKNITLAILCDGMGGHEGGSHASRITINQFKKEFKKIEFINKNKYDNWFIETLKKAKKTMKQYSKKNKAMLDMGTTVTAALITNKIIYVYNIGDSRTYIFYNKLLHQITIDHNLRNYYINKYKYSEEEAATIIGAAALTSALGPKKKTNIEPFIIEKDKLIKYIVLTSDGIHDYIAKPNLESILLAKATNEKKAEVIIKQAIKGKSSDNLTIILLEIN